MEDVNFSMEELHSSQREVSIIFYMKKIFPGVTTKPAFVKISLIYTLTNLCEKYACFFFFFSLDEWKNFLERMDCASLDGLKDEGKEEDLRKWASFRGQTLSRTGDGHGF